MHILKLKETSQSRFIELAETGMGYHFVKARYRFNTETGFVVLGSTYALPVHKINDLSTVFDVTAAVGLDELSEDNFIDGDLEITDNYGQDPLKAREALSLTVPGAIKATTPPPGTTLMVKTVTNGVDGFIRFSYTLNDPRIQATWTVAAKTYATTYRDGVIITSGLSAVGRVMLCRFHCLLYIFFF